MNCSSCLRRSAWLNSGAPSDRYPRLTHHSSLPAPVVPAATGARTHEIGYGRQLVAGGKRISIRFTPEWRHSIDFGKLAA